MIETVETDDEVVVATCDQCGRAIVEGDPIIAEGDWHVHGGTCWRRWKRRKVRLHRNGMGGLCEGCGESLADAEVWETPFGNFHNDCWVDWMVEHTTTAEADDDD